ncbi:classical arabinogalactan protein 9-like [Schistocerca americana]|uniref:classical arabinogalactan protein 9-like n=1 Tax=Schistocerca americana TaxID=7009 RepID=UPI001F4FB456|nr:classical arabinogalactan protein 9-like [Schistocerca americana]
MSSGRPQGTSRLPPPRWDRWLASRHPPDRDDAALVPAPVHMPPLAGEAAGCSVWAAIGARDSWTSFKLDSPPPARSSPAARAPPPQSARPPPPPPPPVLRPPPPPPPPVRASARLDLESCLSVVSLQAPDVAPAYRPRPQPPPRRFELVRNVAAGVSVAPVAPAVRRRHSPPPARLPEPTHSEPTSLSTSPTSSLSVPSSHSAPTSPHSRPRQGRR